MTAQDIKERMADLIATQKETSLAIKELSKEIRENGKQIDKNGKQIDKNGRQIFENGEQIRENGKQIKIAESMFTSQWGKLVESLVEGKAVDLFRSKSILVQRVSTRQKGAYEGENYEFDIIAHNGDEIVIIEVKSTLRVKHVNKFIRQLKNVKLWLSEYKNHKIFGAVAYLRAEEESEIFAENKGFWVIRATGDSAAIINKDNFKPKIF